MLRVPKNSCLFLYCDWLGWLRIIILAIFRLKRSAILFSFLEVVHRPGVKSRTLTWNTEGSFTSSALSKTNLSGYWEITQTQKAYKFWSTVIGHQLFPFLPLPAPGKLLRDTFQLLCQHTFIYETMYKMWSLLVGYVALTVNTGSTQSSCRRLQPRSVLGSIEVM